MHQLMRLNSPHLQTQTAQEDNLLERPDAERTQVKQEGSIARLWSVSCELFLNCFLLNALSRSKERHSSLQFRLRTSKSEEYLHVLTVCA